MKTKRSKLFPPALLAAVCLTVPACQRSYFNTMEKMGVHKREILVDRIESARDAQDDAKEEFKSALEQFLEVVDVENKDLEKTYKRLNEEFEKSEAKANKVTERIDKVQSVAKALFKEWRSELKQFKSRKLREASQESYDETYDRCEELLEVMRDSEEKMEPVLEAFRDQVLFLKHNLNANAIASIQNEATAIQEQVADLVAEMEASIREADAFISAMNAEKAAAAE